MPCEIHKRVGCEPLFGPDVRAIVRDWAIAWDAMPFPSQSLPPEIAPQRLTLYLPASVVANLRSDARAGHTTTARSFTHAADLWIDVSDAVSRLRKPSLQLFLPAPPGEGETVSFDGAVEWLTYPPLTRIARRLEHPLDRPDMDAVELSVTVPGYVTTALGELARRHGSTIAEEAWVLLELWHQMGIETAQSSTPRLMCIGGIVRKRAIDLTRAVPTYGAKPGARASFATPTTRHHNRTTVDLSRRIAPLASRQHTL